MATPSLRLSWETLVKITEIRTAEAPGHGFSTFVKILTDEGITGVGECIHGGDGCSRLIANMAEIIKGENPLDVDRLWEGIRRRYIFNGALAGNVVTAMTGIEIALWDLAGKAYGVPAYQLAASRACRSCIHSSLLGAFAIAASTAASCSCAHAASSTQTNERRNV